jgi:hypothetical protein
VIFPYTFAVGEIAIAIDRVSQFDGMECEIVAPLRWVVAHLVADIDVVQEGLMYGVRFPDYPVTLFAFPHELRKKRPPAQDQDVTETEEATA